MAAAHGLLPLPTQQGSRGDPPAACHVDVNLESLTACTLFCCRSFLCTTTAPGRCHSRSTWTGLRARTATRARRRATACCTSMGPSTICACWRSAGRVWGSAWHSYIRDPRCKPGHARPPKPSRRAAAAASYIMPAAACWGSFQDKNLPMPHCEASKMCSRCGVDSLSSCAPGLHTPTQTASTRPLSW